MEPQSDAGVLRKAHRENEAYWTGGGKRLHGDGTDSEVIVYASLVESEP